jgi:exosortase
MTVRHAAFGLLVGLTAGAFWPAVTRLARLSFSQEQFSHIVLIPVISAALFVQGRRRIFADVQTRSVAGTIVFLCAAMLYWAARTDLVAPSFQLFTAILALVIGWAGAFVSCYGSHAVRRGLFPLLFLFLIVPIPDPWLNRAVFSLQAGSAEVSAAVFQLLGVPVLRDGFIFSLPGVTIEIARECSGIRSTLALLIVALLAGHLLLRSPWTKAALLLVTIPLVVVKNGIRIATLTLLSIHVDPGYLNGSLHHRGGIVFFLLALLLLAPVLWLLQHSEAGADRMSHRHRTERTGRA